MPRTRRDLFSTIRSEGALLPPDLLQRIAEGDGNVAGLTPEAYHLVGNEKLNEAVSRSWNRLLGVWGAFHTAAKDLKATDPGTGLTREKWLLPLFQELGYGRLQAARTFDIGGKTYPISHCWQQTPIHLLGRNVDLDHRSPGVAGAARSSPHGLLQEFMNRSIEHLWGFLSNGLKFRILRESKSLTRRAYVEFDLAGMMDGQVYADFAVLWLLCHQSRVEAERPTGCWLEKWAEEARQEGTRALETLRDGVEKAIEALGRGFLAHPANTALIGRLRSGSLSTQDYYRQLLRAVYRMIFLFVAEDRNLLLTAPPGLRERQRYLRYYSMDRLRSQADRRRGTPHTDLWRGLFLAFRKLGSDTGCTELGLPPLGSYLWSTEATPDLDTCDLANVDLLAAVRSLGYMVDGGIRRPIDYKNLGPEELGSVYESLLELHPDVNADAPTFALNVAAGHERKTSGSYYTPDSLVQCLLDSALEPVMEEAARGRTGEDAAQALLALKICDPAVGSGHFLIAAAHRLARRVASARSGEDEPSPEVTRSALRNVIGRCLYGVDVNPMAAELCRVSLWLEALEPGKPLSFLEHHIRVGNSLLGATPELIASGLPDEAFTPIEGDDKKVCSALKKRNRQEREGQRDMVHLMVKEREVEYNTFASRTRNIDEAPDDTIDEVQRKADQFHRLVVSPDYRHAQQVTDAWCAAFVWKKQADVPFDPITTDTIRRLEADPGALTAAQQREVERLSSEYQFFHWHLAFPEVFANGGFDCVLGNPPWERVKLQEKEWFAERNPEIANAPSAVARKGLIDALKASDPALYRQFLDDSRRAEGESHLLRDSGRYPLCGRGDINLYAVFAEGMRNLLNEPGHTGCVLPTGIATDDTTKFFFQDLVEKKSLANLFSFENEEFLFPQVHHATRFCLITVGSRARPLADAAEFVFFARQVDHLRDPDRRFTLSSEDTALLNPNTRTCPVFRSRRDATLTKAIYRRVPVLIREVHDGCPEGNGWRIKFATMFHMSNDSHLFRTREELEADGWRLEGNIFRKDGARYLPLYEAKMIHHFDHRWGTYQGQTEAQANQGKLPELDEMMHADPSMVSLPRYWALAEEVTIRIAPEVERGWFIGFRDVTGATVFRTVIATIIPRSAVGNSLPLFLSAHADSPALGCFSAGLSSLCCDFAARFKVGGTHLNFFIAGQIPVLPPIRLSSKCEWSGSVTAIRDWIFPRVLELTYTAWDLEPFAQDCGWSGPPLRWDEERRFLLRCELDAAFFHLYLRASPDGQWNPARTAEGAVRDETDAELAELKRYFPTPREAVSYIMDTFPIIRRKDEEKWGEYRTKRVILEIYDAMADAIRTGHPYQTRLDPPPADPSCCHPPKVKSQ